MLGDDTIRKIMELFDVDMLTISMIGTALAFIFPPVNCWVIVVIRCEYQGCSRRPVFSFQGEKPRFCVAHKLEGMLDSRLTAARGKGSVGRPSQVSATQPRMHSRSGGMVDGYPPPRPGVGGRKALENEGEMMLAASQPVMEAQSGSGGRLPGHVTRHAAAQATVSAAAAVIAAMEDEARLDYRASHGRDGQGDRGGLRNGAGFREAEADMYETLHHGGAVGVTKPKTEVGTWTSALFASDRGDGASWEPSRPSLNSSGIGTSLTHGHSDMWPPSVVSSRGLVPPTSLSSVPASMTNVARDGASEVYRMSSAASMGGGNGNGGCSSSQFLDDRNSRGFLGSLSNGGAGGVGSSNSDFMSSFSSTGGGQQQQNNVWQGNDDGHGSGNGGELQWERPSRPRPPPIPAPLPSSWGRAVGVSSSDMHGSRHIGMLPPPTSNQQRLPSLLSSRRPGLPSPSGMGYGDPHGGMAGDGRDGSNSYEPRSREQG